MAADVNMRINVAGYGDRPVSLFAVFAPDTGDLLCSECGEMEMGSIPGFLHVSTTGAEVTCDMRFNEKDLAQAISDYFMMEGMGAVSIDSAITRFKPTNKIQADGVDVSGVKYKLAPDVKNGHVAIIAACFAAQRQRQVSNTMEAMDDLKELSDMQSYSLGLDGWGDYGGSDSDAWA